MPFTFSHPAIVLPLLNKRWKLFSATGLVVGSMAPDFESFIRLDETKIYGHTWGGLFWFDLPMAIGIAILFHAVVRDAVIAHLPTALEERFDHFRNMQWFTYFLEHFFIIVFSMLVGIASHLLWDAFTHLNLYDPDSIRSTISISGIRVYKLLQFACSIIGLIVIARVVYKLPRVRIVVKTKMKYQYWLILTLVAILMGTVLVTVVFKNTDLNSFIILYLYIALSSFLAAVVIVSFVYKLFMKKEI